MATWPLPTRKRCRPAAGAENAALLGICASPGGAPAATSPGVEPRTVTARIWHTSPIMATPRRTPARKRYPALASGSWIALLAATTLGVDGANTVHAEVRADEDLVESRDYRLVVQSFDARRGGSPGRARAPSRHLPAGRDRRRASHGVCGQPGRAPTEQAPGCDRATAPWSRGLRPESQTSSSTAGRRARARAACTGSLGSRPVPRPCRFASLARSRPRQESQSRALRARVAR